MKGTRSGNGGKAWDEQQRINGFVRHCLIGSQVPKQAIETVNPVHDGALQWHERDGTAIRVQKTMQYQDESHAIDLPTLLTILDIFLLVCEPTATATALFLALPVARRDMT